MILDGLRNGEKHGSGVYTWSDGSMLRTFLNARRSFRFEKIRQRRPCLRRAMVAWRDAWQGRTLWSGPFSSQIQQTDRQSQVKNKYQRHPKTRAKRIAEIPSWSEVLMGTPSVEFGVRT